MMDVRACGYRKYSGLCISISVAPIKLTRSFPNSVLSCADRDCMSATTPNKLGSKQTAYTM
jgi:hypothetical protein